MFGGCQVLDIKDNDLVKLQNVELGLLNKFCLFCDNHGISFQATFGTLLGAIRHGGFIPWDDDVDLAMMYDDYLKLIDLSEKDGYLYDNVFLQNIHTDSHYLLSWCKVRDPSIALRELHTSKESMGGIFLDIFPIINFPKSKIKQIIVINKIRFYISISSILTPKSNVVKTLVFKFISIFLKPSTCIRKIEKILKKTHLNNYNSGTSYLLSHNVAIKTDWINTVCKVKFCDKYINVPLHFDEVLKSMYGDYNILPNEEKRIHSHVYEELELPEDC